VILVRLTLSGAQGLVALNTSLARADYLTVLTVGGWPRMQPRADDHWAGKQAANAPYMLQFHRSSVVQLGDSHATW
jgi:hypothetical protein